MLLRREFLGGLGAMTVLGPAAWAHAEVHVSIGINVPVRPALVAIPSSPVVYAPSLHANYFFYGNQYYVFANDVWYVGRGHNGPWVALAPEFIPRPILAVPVQYYRVAPSHWHGWHRHEPPRWAPAWGRRWQDERREERHERREERHERREERHERREDRREHRRGH